MNGTVERVNVQVVLSTRLPSTLWAGYLNEDLLRLWFTTLSAPQDLSISVLVCCFWPIDAFLTCSESTLYNIRLLDAYGSAFWIPRLANTTRGFLSTVELC